MRCGECGSLFVADWREGTRRYYYCEDCGWSWEREDYEEDDDES